MTIANCIHINHPISVLMAGKTFVPTFPRHLAFCFHSFIHYSYFFLPLEQHASSPLFGIFLLNFISQDLQTKMREEREEKGEILLAKVLCSGGWVGHVPNGVKKLKAYYFRSAINFEFYFSTPPTGAELISLMQN